MKRKNPGDSSMLLILEAGALAYWWWSSQGSAAALPVSVPAGSTFQPTGGGTGGGA